LIFSVIYSFDCPHAQPVGYFMPPKNQRRLWRQTEGDEQYDLDVWEKGKHRKFCAEDLTRKQFDAFVNHCSLVAEDVETMGALTGLGWRPAICFNSQQEYTEGYANAYVTPYPSYATPPGGGRLEDAAWQERSWERVRKAVISTYS
jgi:hypothetical protein